MKYPCAGVDQLLFLYSCFHWILSSSAQRSSPVVLLTDGSPLRGMEVKAKNDKLVTEFWGIPFAEPPINNLRFRKPVHKRPWRSTLNATKLPNACIQSPDLAWGDFQGSTMWNPNTETSEDCLYLNIWVPGKVDSKKKLSVMVWIYGGGFWSGCSTLDVYDGKILSSEENIILVSMNYRVSLFGFLYLGRPEVPGNMGLWDQLLALKWVKQNIIHFGGDPDSVTIFGESAGGASVTMHVVSEHSRPYFKRAVTQSGSVTAPWAMEPRELMIKRAVHLCEAMKCGNMTLRDESTWNRDKIFSCVMGATADKLREVEWAPVVNVEVPEFADFPWVPVMDGEFFTQDPKIAVKNGHFKRGELMVGSNMDEANFFIVYQFPKIFNSQTLFSKSEHIVTDHMWYRAANLLLPRKYRKNLLVRAAIFHEYQDWGLPGSAIRRQGALDSMMGDYLFVCNVNEFAQYYAESGSTVYYYYFAHRSSQQTWPEWMGVLHGYEINFIFGEPLNTDKYSYTADEQELSRRFMRYWANFARTGNPNRNPDGTWMADLWPVYSRANQEYLTLAVNSAEIGRGPRRRYCAFWKSYVPNLEAATGHNATKGGNSKCTNEANGNSAMPKLMVLILLLFVYPLIY